MRILLLLLISFYSFGQNQSAITVFDWLQNTSRNITPTQPDFSALDIYFDFANDPKRSGGLYTDYSETIEPTTTGQKVLWLKDVIGSYHLKMIGTGSTGVPVTNTDSWRPDQLNYTDNAPWYNAEERALEIRNLRGTRFFIDGITENQPIYGIRVYRPRRTINNENLAVDDFARSYEGSYDFGRVSVGGTNDDLAALKGVPYPYGDTDQGAFNEIIIEEIIADGANSTVTITRAGGNTVQIGTLNLGAGAVNDLGWGSNGHAQNVTLYYQAYRFTKGIPDNTTRETIRGLITDVMDLGFQTDKPYITANDKVWSNTNPTKSWTETYTFNAASSGAIEDETRRKILWFQYGNAAGANLNDFGQMTPNPNKSGVGTRQNITYSNGTGFFTATAHGLPSDLEEWSEYAIGLVGSDLPSAFSENTPYYVVNATVNTFQLSNRRNGTPITGGDNGTGSQELIEWTNKTQLTRQRSDFSQLTQGDKPVLFDELADDVYEVAHGLTNNSTRHHFYSSTVLPDPMLVTTGYFVTNYTTIGANFYPISSISQTGASIDFVDAANGFRNIRSLFHVGVFLQVVDVNGVASDWDYEIEERDNIN